MHCNQVTSTRMHSLLSSCSSTILAALPDSNWLYTVVTMVVIPTYFCTIYLSTSAPVKFWQQKHVMFVYFGELSMSSKSLDPVKCKHHLIHTA